MEPHPYVGETLQSRTQKNFEANRDGRDQDVVVGALNRSQVVKKGKGM